MENNYADLVKIWTASTAEAFSQPSAASLSKEEKAQACLLKQADDGKRFLAARTLLRHALSEVMDGEIPPEEWRYLEGANGKPMMASDLPPLEFNLSHSGDCVAVGIGSSKPIGIDVESAAPDGRNEIVRDALSESERKHLDRLSGAEQWATFLKFWTLKEACAKALGLGASLDFSYLEVTLDPPHILSPPGLLDPDEAFFIENRSIMIDRNTYCLSVATITGETKEVSFLYQPLTNNCSELLDDKRSRQPENKMN